MPSRTEIRANRQARMAVIQAEIDAASAAIARMEASPAKFTNLLAVKRSELLNLSTEMARHQRNEEREGAAA